MVSYNHPSLYSYYLEAANCQLANTTLWSSLFGVYGIWVNRDDQAFSDLTYTDTIFIMTNDIEILAYTIGASATVASRYIVSKAETIATRLSHSSRSRSPDSTWISQIGTWISARTFTARDTDTTTTATTTLRTAETSRRVNRRSFYNYHHFDGRKFRRVIDEESRSPSLPPQMRELQQQSPYEQQQQQQQQPSPSPTSKSIHDHDVSVIAVDHAPASISSAGTALTTTASSISEKGDGHHPTCLYDNYSIPRSPVASQKQNQNYTSPSSPFHQPTTRNTLARNWPMGPSSGSNLYHQEPAKKGNSLEEKDVDFTTSRGSAWFDDSSGGESGDSSSEDLGVRGEAR